MTAPAKPTIIGTVVVGVYPHGIAITPDGKTAYVANTGPNTGRGGSQTVSVVDVASQTVRGVAVTPDGKHAYVTDTERDQVVVLSTSPLRTGGRIAVGSTPWAVAFTSDGSHAYVTNANDNTVSVIDTTRKKVTGTIPLGSFTYTDAVTKFTQPNQIPTAIAIAPDNRYMCVACNVSGSVAVIDTTTTAVSNTVEIGLADEPTGIAFA